MKIKWELLPAAIAAVAAVPTFAQQIGPLNTVQCSSTFVRTVGTASTITAVTGVAGKVIFLCGWSMTNTGTAGTGSFQLTYGTGTTCSANNALLTSNLSVSNNSPATDHTFYATMQVPPANSTAGANPDLCLTVTSGVGGIVYFGQY